MTSFLANVYSTLNTADYVFIKKINSWHCIFFLHFLFQEIKDDCTELQEELSTVDFQKYEDSLLEYSNILAVDGSLRELDLLCAKADHFHTKLEQLKHSLNKTTALVSNREKSESGFLLSDLSETVKSFDEITKKYKKSLEEHSKAVAILHSVKKVSCWIYLTIVYQSSIFCCQYYRSE